MDRLVENHTYTGTVEGYSSEGLGIVRLEGAVVFVPGTVRGETVDLRITKVMKTCAAGTAVHIHNPSPDRVKPVCPYFGVCGGCVYRHMTYAEELFAKRARVDDALARIGGLALATDEILGAKEPLHYRNKCQYPVDAKGIVGFYRRRSHQVVEVASCAIQTPQADDAARTVRRWMVSFGISGYDERTGRGLVRHVYVRTNRAGECLVCLVINGRRVPFEEDLVMALREAVAQTVGVVLNCNRSRGNVILGDHYRTLWGQDYLMDTLCGLTFKLSVPSFYQVNRDQAEVLYQKALKLARLTGDETVLDLYCGAGTITLCMAEKAKRVLGCEIVPEAIRDAEENAKRNGIQNAEFFCGDAAAVAEKLKGEGLRPDVVTVDPPRKGLAEDVIATVAAMEPERVVYVSCDPATLARDLKRFEALHYHACRATAVDLFPGTAHVETVVLMSRA